MFGKSVSRRPVPPDLVDDVGPPGFERIRSWGDEAPPFADDLHDERIARIQRLWDERGRPDRGLDLSFLTISGGASYGAYSAGLLCGWTEHGTRPRFQVVTGVSVGALIAPFAFLGPTHDATLAQAFTEMFDERLAETRLLSVVMGALSVLDPAPLEELVARLLSDELLRRVSAETRDGRQLLVGTTNLDAGRFVIWNLGRIVARETPDAFDLARRIVLGSASVPGVLPPVLVDVAHPNRPDDVFQEAHVDGGATTNVFAYPYQLRIDVDDAIPAPIERHVYLVQNDYGRWPYRPVPMDLFQVVRSAMSIQNHHQGLGDVLRVREACRRDGFSFHLGAIPPDFDQTPDSELDSGFMSALFERGRADARDGYPWRDRPPEGGG